MHVVYTKWPLESKKLSTQARSAVNNIMLAYYLLLAAPQQETEHQSRRGAVGIGLLQRKN